MKESLEDIEWDKLTQLQEKKNKLKIKKETLNTAGINKSIFDKIHLDIELELDEVKDQIKKIGN